MLPFNLNHNIFTSQIFPQQPNNVNNPNTPQFAANLQTLANQAESLNQPSKGPAAATTKRSNEHLSPDIENHDKIIKKLKEKIISKNISSTSRPSQIIYADNSASQENSTEENTSQAGQTAINQSQCYSSLRSKILQINLSYKETTDLMRRHDDDRKRCLEFINKSMNELSQAQIVEKIDEIIKSSTNHNTHFIATFTKQLENDISIWINQNGCFAEAADNFKNIALKNPNQSINIPPDQKHDEQQIYNFIKNKLLIDKTRIEFQEKIVNLLNINHDERFELIEKIFFQIQRSSEKELQFIKKILNTLNHVDTEISLNIKDQYLTSKFLEEEKEFVSKREALSYIVPNKVYTLENKIISLFLKPEIEINELDKIKISFTELKKEFFDTFFDIHRNHESIPINQIDSTLAFYREWLNLHDKIEYLLDGLKFKFDGIQGSSKTN